MERAAGNAFFAEELVSATQHAGSGDALPAELADLLLIRLDRLSDRAHELVRLVAVAGGRIPHDLLGEVSGWPSRNSSRTRCAKRSNRTSWRRSARSATASGTRCSARRSTTICCPASGFGCTPRSRGRSPPGRPAANAAELAHHARRSHDLPAAFRASVQAGEEAMQLAAPQEAMQHYEAALELLPSVPAPEPA